MKEINILIDAGYGMYGDSLVAALKELEVESIDYLIATHPHDASIGGMESILTNFYVVFSQQRSLF